MTVERASSLDVDAIADAVEEVGFECTDCGDCCTADDEPLAVTVYPDERRALAEAADLEADEATEPSPFGDDETFEWTVRRDGCGDCYFYDGQGCSVYTSRPTVCRTYPFRVVFDGTPEAERTVALGSKDDNAVLAVGACEGTGRDIPRRDAVELARRIKHRAVKEEREAFDLLEAYERVEPPEGYVVVHDSEGAHLVER